VCAIGTSEMEMLSACSKFRSVSEHAETLALTFPLAQDRQACLRMLDQLRPLGGMIALSELLGECRRRDPPLGGSNRIEWLAIPTHRKQTELSRAIRSYVTHMQKFGRQPRLIITSDAEDDSRSVVSRLSEELSFQAWYAGPCDKISFAKSLCRDGNVPANTVRFALFGEGYGITTGANRNAVLLHTVGSRVLSVDDDTLCRPGLVPQESAAPDLLRYACGHDPAEIWCFDEVNDAVQHVNCSQLDILTEHERFLSKWIGQVVMEGWAVGGASSLDGMCPHVIDRIIRGSGSIRTTYNGSVGDSGFHSDFGIVAHWSPSTRERLMSSKSYSRVLESRAVLRQSIATTITHDVCSGIGMFVGLDNVDLLPPFFPNYRGQDRLFALLLAKCDSDAFAAHLPFTLDHLPISTRVYADERDREIRVADAVNSIISAWQGSIGIKSTADKLISLGHHLNSIGKLPVGEFTELVQTLLAGRASSLALHCETLLSRYGHCYPEYWVQDLRRRVESIVDALPAGLRFADVGPSFSTPQDTVMRLQTLIAQFGDLLIWWPTILQRAAELRGEGVELARPVGER
jgi:hypothetical protein